MKCQMPGCHRNSSRTTKIQGIYNGIYIENLFNHCAYHRDIDLSSKADSIRAEAVAVSSLVNPFAIASKVSRKIG